LVELALPAPPQAAPGASTQPVRQELVVIDAGVPGYPQLVEGVRAAASAERQFEVVILDAHRDGIQQVTDALAGRQELEALHILSHGTAGAVQLGSTWLDAQTLPAHRSAVAGWQSALAEDADLLLYGCDLAADENGAKFISSLAALTGADVAASEDPTGASHLGGDWDLEARVGTIETVTVASGLAQQAWNGLLAPLTVSTTNDVLDGTTTSIANLVANPGADGKISLREAIAAANNTNGADTISLPAGTYRLTIPDNTEDNGLRGDLDINDDLTISGAGAGSTIVDANGLDRAFDIESGASLISGVTIRGGLSTGGGGIFVGSGATSLTLDRVVITANAATGLGSDGGGIYVDRSSATITDSTIDGNSADFGGGISNFRSTITLNRVTLSGNDAAFSGGAVYSFGNDASVDLTNVTVSGNTAAILGGGIYNSRVMTITNSTIVANTALVGAGIAEFNPGSLSLKNSIVANNGSQDANTPVTSLGYNIDSGNTLGLAGPGDLSNTDPMLGPLQNNGGLTATHALLAGSPAINAGSAVGAPAIDQRGAARDASPDIGAYEYGAQVLGITVTPTGGLTTTEAGGTATFTLVLTSQPTADVTIPITSSDLTEGTVSTPTLTFTAANWNVAQTVTVTGVDDFMADGDIAYSIVTGAASSTDPNYTGLNPSDVAVTNTDNDTAGITVSAISGPTTEAGGTATFTVVLDSQPTADVTIGLSSSDPTEGTVAPGSLTFTAATWNVAQTVTVTGVQDFVNDGDTIYSVILGAASSFDGRYIGRNPSDVTLANRAVPNVAPINTLPGAQSSLEDTEVKFSVATGNAISVSDIDAGNNPIRVSLIAADGTLTLSTLSGLTIVSGTNGTGEVIFDGRITTINAALNGLVFRPTADFTGLTSLQIETNDLSNTGTGGAQGATGSVDIMVSPVNDAPSITANSLGIDEGGAVVLTSANLNSGDPDNTAAHLTYTVSNTTNGRFELVAAPGVAITSFTQEQVDAGQVRFAHNGGEAAPSYEARVSDGSLSDGPQAATITFTNINEAPTTVSLSTSVLDENTDTTAGYTVGTLSTSDVDTGDSHTYTIVGGSDQGVFSIVSDQLRINTGVVDFETKSSYQLRVRSTDAGGLFVEQDFVVTIHDLNEPVAPAANNNSDSVNQVAAPKVQQPTGGTTPIPPPEIIAVARQLTAGSALAALPVVPVLPGRPGGPSQQPTNDAVEGGMADSTADGSTPLPEGQAAELSGAVPDPARTETDGPEVAGERAALNPSPPAPPIRVAQAAVPPFARNGPIRMGQEGRLPADTQGEIAGLPRSDAPGLEVLEKTLHQSGLPGELDRLRGEVEQKGKIEQTVIASTVAVTTGLSVGYVVWLLRGGLLLASLLSSLPAWHLFDPLPVLSRVKRSNEEQQDDASDDPLERMFDRAKTLMRRVRKTRPGAVAQPKAAASPSTRGDDSTMAGG
jgi:hypothetical protein